MFIDTARISVWAGRGGKGVNSFYRDKYTKGIPDGGDGGNGGNVIIRVSTDVHTLIDFQYRQTFKADKGGNGSGKQKRGKDGRDMIIKAPCGTLVYDAETKVFLKDLVDPGDEMIAAQGGRGGRGNRSKKPATEGEAGEDRRLFLELKLLADVGIIGFPNAGKSTLISRISKAHPRIAHFPFTTKYPVLGMVEYEDSVLRVAEIPGLIEGSHKGKGLGDQFLRHAERTKLFIHLIDLSRENAEEVHSDYAKINNELRLYKKELAHKPQIVVGNKIDIEISQKNLDILKEKFGMDIIPISAKEGTGTEKLVKALFQKLHQVRTLSTSTPASPAGGHA